MEFFLTWCVEYWFAGVLILFFGIVVLCVVLDCVKKNTDNFWNIKKLKVEKSKQDITQQYEGKLLAFKTQNVDEFVKIKETEAMEVTTKSTADIQTTKAQIELLDSLTKNKDIVDAYLQAKDKPENDWLQESYEDE